MSTYAPEEIENEASFHGESAAADIARQSAERDRKLRKLVERWLVTAEDGYAQYQETCASELSAVLKLEGK